MFEVLSELAGILKTASAVTTAPAENTYFQGTRHIMPGN
jgi:hypothetical protein